MASTTTSAARDLDLGDDGDLAFDAAAGTFGLVRDAAAIRQHVQTRMRLVLGEWALDTSLGVDWFGKVFAKASTDAMIAAELSRAITETPGVVRLVSLDVQRGPNRSASVTWSAQIDGGRVGGTLELEV